MPVECDLPVLKRCSMVNRFFNISRNKAYDKYPIDMHFRLGINDMQGMSAQIISEKPFVLPLGSAEMRSMHNHRCPHTKISQQLLPCHERVSQFMLYR